MKITPVVLAGGAGTRLWPLSNNEKPKQFHEITGDGTLLESTIKRLLPLNPDTCIIATSGAYENMSMKELNKTGIAGKVLVEPEAKNTAPAILYSAIYLTKAFDDSIMIILPADHYIKKNDAFIDTLMKAIEEAENDSLVTIGIKPASPETGYGYIKAGSGNGIAFRAERFVEKPDRETAERYIKEGNYFWNAGIFVWKASAIIKAFRLLMPELYAEFSPLLSMKAEEIALNTGKALDLKKKIFSNIKGISIDYGIMEKAENRTVIPADLGWTDLGSWNSIDEVLQPDNSGNRTPAYSPVFVSSSNCTVFSEGRTIALVGVENLVVVESGGSILVMNKSCNQEVRKVVDILKTRKD